MGRSPHHLSRDQIAGRDNAFAPIVKASRFQPLRGAKGMIDENVTVMKSFIKDYVTDRKSIPLSQLASGEGAIIEFRKYTGRIQRPYRSLVRGFARLHPHEVQSPLEQRGKELGIVPAMEAASPPTAR